MIMRRAIELLGTTAFFSTLFLISAASCATSADAGDHIYASRRVDLATARPVKRPVKRTVRWRRSMVSQAASGKALGEIPPKPLDGSLVKGEVRRVGFVEDFHGYVEPGCGCGDVICDCGEAVCGIEPGCDCGHGGECVCGVEVVEPGCAYVQPECGYVEAPGCGIEGCTECGIAPLHAPVCGSDVIVDYGCDSCAGAAHSSVPVFFPLLECNWKRFDFFCGSQGFKGPANFASINANNPDQRIGSSSFGFFQGFNEGRSLKHLLGFDISSQFGLRATQSNISGADFSTARRHQIFLTAGLFRRVDYGLQLGLAVDYLNDDWYYQVDLAQLRGEISWNTGGVITYGFQYMVGVDDDVSDTVVRDLSGNIVRSTDFFEATDQYRFMLKRKINRCGSYTGFVGWTDDDDGLVGSLLEMPLNHCLLMNSGATYLIPEQGRNSGGNQHESWNISLGLTWRPGGISYGRLNRPMFDVADNGTFIVNRR